MNLIRKAGFLLVCATMVAAGNGTAQNVQRTSQGIKCATQGMDVNVEFYSPYIKQPSYPSGSEPGDWWYPFFRFVRSTSVDGQGLRNTIHSFQ